MKETEHRAADAAMDERRDFLKKAGKAAVTAPAVALLLSANGKQASAQVVELPYGQEQDNPPE